MRVTRVAKAGAALGALTTLITTPALAAPAPAEYLASKQCLQLKVSPIAAGREVTAIKFAGGGCEFSGYITVEGAGLREQTDPDKTPAVKKTITGSGDITARLYNAGKLWTELTTSAK